uniref:(northern house mosquito) hypothetical protein n=1 Tax=Culex pipiens TaxID=7175 RepID=A0A8D8C8Z2_CULPI
MFVDSIITILIGENSAKPFKCINLRYNNPEHIMDAACHYSHPRAVVYTVVRFIIDFADFPPILNHRLSCYSMEDTRFRMVHISHPPLNKAPSSNAPPWVPA